MLRLAALCSLVLLAGCSKGGGGGAQNIGGVRYTPASSNRRVNANNELKKQQALKEKQEKALRQLNGEDADDASGRQQNNKNEKLFGN